MKAKVLIPFTDKETGQKRKKGGVINITAKRFNEITAKGRYIEAVDEPVITNDKDKEKTR
jgi:hypothetical protein